MREPTQPRARSEPIRWQYRIGLRFLLTMVVIAALLLAWVAREHRRAAGRTALVAELGSVGVLPLLEEPTGVSQLAKGVIPKYERRLGELIGRGWFDRPTVFVCMRLEDENVDYAADRLRCLGTVREAHTQGTRLTQRGIQGLQTALPGVNVVPSANPALHRYFRDQVDHEHFAGEGLALAGFLTLGLAATLTFLAWPLVRRERRRPSDDGAVHG